MRNTSRIISVFCYFVLDNHYHPRILLIKVFIPLMMTDSEIVDNMRLLAVAGPIRYVAGSHLSALKVTC